MFKHLIVLVILALSVVYAFEVSEEELNEIKSLANRETEVDDDVSVELIFEDGKFITKTIGGEDDVEDEPLHPADVAGFEELPESTQLLKMKIYDSQVAKMKRVNARKSESGKKSDSKKSGSTPKSKTKSRSKRDRAKTSKASWGQRSRMRDFPTTVVSGARGALGSVGSGLLGGLSWVLEGDYRERSREALLEAKDWLLDDDYPDVYAHADFLADNLDAEENEVVRSGRDAFWSLMFASPYEAQDYFGSNASGMPHVSTLKHLMNDGVLVLINDGVVCTGPTRRYPAVMALEGREIKRMLYKRDWESLFDDDIDFEDVKHCF